MFQLMMGLQDQVVPDLLPGDPRSKSSLSSFSSSSLVQVHTHAYNISMLLDQSNVKYITSSGRRDIRKYEFTDHAAHLIARSLCKIQKIKDKQSQTGSLFTFVCSKKMITSKLNALKQSKGHHKGTVLWRMVTNTMETSEKFALKVLLRTLMLGTLCTLVELWFMVISVAIIAWIIGRRFLRVPTLGQTPVTQRLSLWQLHHVAAYISFPSILIGKIVVTLEQFQPMAEIDPNMSSFEALLESDSTIYVGCYVYCLLFTLHAARILEIYEEALQRHLVAGLIRVNNNQLRPVVIIQPGQLRPVPPTQPARGGSRRPSRSF